mgnify:CR=1 FL=1
MTARIRIAHHFDCSAERLYGLLLDPDFDAQLIKSIGTSCEELDREEREGETFLKLSFDVDRDIPSFVRKLAGDNTRWLETRLWKHSDRMNEWSIEFGALANRVDLKGTFKILEKGDGGSTRMIEGTAKVRIPLVGSKVESFIVDQTQDTFDQSAVFIRDWLRDNPE